MQLVRRFMCRIGIIFEIAHAQTQFGERIVVTGNVEELGMWDAPVSAVELTTDSSTYPSWKTLGPVWVTVPTSGEATAEEDDGTASTLSAFDSDEDVCLIEEMGTTGEHPVRASRTGAQSPRTHDELCSLQIEYKYLLDRRCVQGGAGLSAVQWEESIGNRTVVLPLVSGAIYTVTDCAFDTSAPNAMKRTSLADLRPDVVRGTPGDKVGCRQSGRELDSASCSSTSSYVAHSSSTVGPFTWLSLA